MDKLLLYFGCRNNQPGHYLWKGRHSTRYEEFQRYNFNYRVLGMLDDTFVVKGAAQGEYSVCYLPALMIIAWPDYSVDKRPGSNSALVAHGYTSVEEIMRDALVQYPDVVKRQQVELVPYKYPAT